MRDKVFISYSHKDKDFLNQLQTHLKPLVDAERISCWSLRNVALTAPCFHDGQSPTLENTVRKMAWMQFDKKLTDEDVQSLVSFLKSLTDKKRAAAVGLK